MSIKPTFSGHTSTQQLACTITPSLPSRPLPLQDEWLETYLGRLARSLGKVRPWRNDLDLLRPMVANHANPHLDGVPCYEGILLPGWATLTRGAQIQYCPTCMAEHHFIRARWRLAHFQVCPTHGTILKDGLVEPAITANYKRVDKRAVNDVGVDEIMDSAASAMPDALAHIRSIWRPFELAVLNQETGDALLDPLAWALLVERLLDVVATGVRGPLYPPHTMPRFIHRTWWLDQLGLKISPDLSGVTAFLLKICEGVYRRAVVHGLRYLIDEEVRRETIMSRLPLAQLKSRVLAAYPDERGAKSKGALPQSLHPADHYSFNEMEGLLACPTGLLNFMVRGHYFPGVRRIPFGRKTYVFVPRSEVEECRRWLASCMTVEEVMTELGIDRQHYWALIDSKLLRPIKIGSWRRYRRKDIATLLDKLNSVSRPIPVNTQRLQPVLGDWLHTTNRPRQAMCQVLHEILDGQFPLYRKLNKTGLQAYLVDYAAIARLQKLSIVWRAENRMSDISRVQLDFWVEQEAVRDTA